MAIAKPPLPEVEVDSSFTIQPTADDFSPKKRGPPIGSHTITKQDAIIQLQNLAKRLGRTPTARDVESASKQRECRSVKTFKALFVTFNNALWAARLPIPPSRKAMYFLTCYFCRNRKKVRENSETGQLICKACTDKQRKKEICAHCPPGTRPKLVASHLPEPDNRPLCQKHYRASTGKSQAKRGECRLCGNGPDIVISYLHPNPETADTRNICETCWRNLTGKKKSTTTSPRKS